MSGFSHVDNEGRLSMVDVSAKPVQRRVAKATGRIYAHPKTISLIRDNALKKGDVLTVAKVAGIQAAKETSVLIPLCHPLALDRVNVEVRLSDDAVEVTAEVISTGRTGVEMEALTSVSVALLTIYDMCKAVDKSMRISDIELVKKTKTPVEKH
ncbi:MAG TPA: cyclic pyranopterin monophosphate synthase MoaC [Candidatus Hydrogenedentes bacterium]|nr:cyclic pyranopterin monophosphate synthase MoaC [Candidatus Hydrogenedentota bacterium]HPG69248.1 cyclic pyranopterin monophosphate synthase MoaC [Candidatus Hydrogenedentota bacterium]